MKGNKFFVSLLPFLTLFFSQGNIFAQGASADSSFYLRGLFNSRALYHQAFASQSALYNGSKYGEYLFRFKEGHPFFNSSGPESGSIVYDGISYDSVLMRYDEITDVVVINYYVDRIQLLSEKVESFRIFNSDFIRLVKDSLSDKLERTGFYNILYKGKIWLLKKQDKSIREVISTTELERFVDSKDHYYVKKDGRIYSIRSSSELLNLFGERKKDVQRFIKANSLSFRDDRQNMLTKATAYYDNLNPQQ